MAFALMSSTISMWGFIALLSLCPAHFITTCGGISNARALQIKIQTLDAKILILLCNCKHLHNRICILIVKAHYHPSRLFHTKLVAPPTDLRLSLFKQYKKNCGSAPHGQSHNFFFVIGSLCHWTKLSFYHLFYQTDVMIRQCPFRLDPSL